MWKIILLLIASFAVLPIQLTSCTQAISPTVEITAQPKVSASATLRPTKSPFRTPTPEPTVTHSKPDRSAVTTIWEVQYPGAPKWKGLSPTGPWIVFQESFVQDPVDGLATYIMNFDGSGNIYLGQLFLESFICCQRAKMSPDGQYMAFQSYLDPDDEIIMEKELLIFQLHPVQLAARFRLVSQNIIEAIREMETDPSEYLYTDEATAIKASGELEWSPDGRYLAYTAAIESLNSDVYVFDTQTRTSERLTSGPTQASLMGWSPDSRWIVHLAWTKGEQNPFDGMALPVLQAIWAASIDNEGNGEVLLLERITWDSSRPLILGWVSPEEFLVESGDSEVLLEDVTTYIRKIGIRSQAVEAIYEGEYAKTAFDPQTQTLAFVRSAAGDANGMFMISPSDSQFRQIDRGEWNGIWWISGTDWFYVENWFYTESQSDHVSAFFTEQGERLDLFSFENTAPIPSPDGKYLAFIGRDMEGQGGVRIYNIQGIWLKQILPDLDTEDVDFFWKPDSSGFWFINHSYEYFEGVIEYSFQGDSVIQWDAELRNVEHYAHPVWMGNP